MPQGQKITRCFAGYYFIECTVFPVGRGSNVRISRSVASSTNSAPGCALLYRWILQRSIERY